VWAWAAASNGLRPGRVLGGYELVCAVAQGGMGRVWAARRQGSRGFSKLVALKTVLASLARDAHIERMFLEEAKLASRVRHPNVCQVLDLGEENGVLFQALEWVDGESLATLLRAAGGRLPCAVAATIARDAARGLHAAHTTQDAEGRALGIVHRDVSPQNILVDLAGMAKIADFGVAKSTRSEGPRTEPGVVRGKIPYMPPEQLYGEDVDARADVFALGVVLYEATTGTHPFAAATDVAVLARIADGEPAPSPTTLVDGYPEALAAVILRAIAKDADARWPNMAEMATALDEALRSLDGSGHDDVAGFVRDVVGGQVTGRRALVEGRADGTAPRGAKLRTLGLVALLAAVVAAITFAALASGSRKSPPTTVAQLAPPSPPATSVDFAPPAPPIEAPVATASAAVAVAAPPVVTASARPPAKRAPPTAPSTGVAPSASPSNPADHDELRTRE